MYWVNHETTRLMKIFQRCYTAAQPGEGVLWEIQHPPFNLQILLARATISTWSTPSDHFPVSAKYWVEDVGPTLYKYYTNVLCLLGLCLCHWDVDLVCKYNYVSSFEAGGFVRNFGFKWMKNRNSTTSRLHQWESHLSSQRSIEVRRKRLAIYHFPGLKFVHFDPNL